MEVTKEQVDVAQKEAELAYQKLSLLKDAYFKAETDYIRKSRCFQDLDHKLALTDGRLKKIAPSATKKTQKQPQLTLDQLKAIAMKLGFDLTTIEEPEEENEEIVEALMQEEEESHEA